MHSALPHNPVRLQNLREPELTVGYLLTCQSLPAGDTLTVDYDS